MTFITTVTQKGQITLPKNFRSQLGISSFDKVLLTLKGKVLTVEVKKDILDFAGSIPVKKGKSVAQAREAFEKKYQRV